MAKQPNQSPMRFATAGFELIGGMLVFMWFGYLFDNWQNTEPWGLVVGAIVGIVGGLYKLIREVQSAYSEDD